MLKKTVFLSTNGVILFRLNDGYEIPAHLRPCRAVGIHPNTVRLYLEWGLLPAVERSSSGYRLFTQKHLDCLRLARTIYAAEYPGRDLRASGNEIIQYAVADDWSGALEKTREHLASVKAELKQATMPRIYLNIGHRT